MGIFFIMSMMASNISRRKKNISKSRISGYSLSQLPAGYKKWLTYSSIVILCSYIILEEILNSIFILSTPMTEYNATTNLLMFSWIGFLIPLVGAYYFRGFLFRGLRQHFSFWFSAIVSSACLGISIFDVTIGLYVFFSGIIYCYIYERYESLSLSLTANILSNLGLVCVGIIVSSF
jgi:membrane protease YdiL (CAAX protease family)